MPSLQCGPHVLPPHIYISPLLSSPLLSIPPIPSIHPSPMVDVDRRISPALTSTALRRLSARAAGASAVTRNGVFNFSSIASSIMTGLNQKRIKIEAALTESELSRIESRLNLTFPPDLRAVLSLGLPSSSGFASWRHLDSVSASADLPIVSLSLQLTRNRSSWPGTSWGPRPPKQEMAQLTRAKLRRAPPMIPLYRNCYLPSRPCLAGNPVFYVDETRIFVCASDISHFFGLDLAGVGSGFSVPKPARWIEFWSDAAAAYERRRRKSSSSSSERSSSSSASSLADPGLDPERFVEIRPPRVPGWVGEYLDRIGSVLEMGGWGEAEVREMVHASASCSSDDVGGEMDGREALDVLTVKADRWADWLERAGWRSEELTGLGLDSGFNRVLKEERRRTVVEFPPEIRYKVEKLAQEICNC